MSERDTSPSGRVVRLQRVREHGLLIPRNEDGTVIDPEAWELVDDAVRTFYRHAQVESGGGVTLIDDPAGVVPSTTPRAGFVYLLHYEDPNDEELFKIGKTTDLPARFRALRVQFPYPVRVLWAWRSADIDYTEKCFHAEHASQRLNGEWFRIDLDRVFYLLTVKQFEPLSRYVADPRLEHHPGQQSDDAHLEELNPLTGESRRFAFFRLEHLFIRRLKRRREETA
jgi:hypothetical protein